MDMSQAKWKNRRRYLIFVTVFTMLVMVFALVFRPEASVSRVVIEMGFLAIVSFVGSYVFGAVWDQANERKHNANAGSERTVDAD